MGNLAKFEDLEEWVVVVNLAKFDDLEEWEVVNLANFDDLNGRVGGDLAK